MTQTINRFIKNSSKILKRKHQNAETVALQCVWHAGELQPTWRTHFFQSLMELHSDQPPARVFTSRLVSGLFWVLERILSTCVTDTSGELSRIPSCSFTMKDWWVSTESGCCFVVCLSVSAESGSRYGSATQMFQFDQFLICLGCLFMILTWFIGRLVLAN